MIDSQTPWNDAFHDPQLSELNHACGYNRLGLLLKWNMICDSDTGEAYSDNQHYVAEVYVFNHFIANLRLRLIDVQINHVFAKIYHLIL